MRTRKITLHKKSPVFKTNHNIGFRVKTKMLPLYLMQEKIISTVENVSGKPREYIFERTRNRDRVDLRKIVMYLLYINKCGSLGTIGQICGGYDHATVLFSVNKTKTLLESDKQFIELFNMIKKALK